MGPSLGRDLYQMEGFVPNILISMFSNLKVNISLTFKPWTFEMVVALAGWSLFKCLFLLPKHIPYEP
jgi:hypothetical protein